KRTGTIGLHRPSTDAIEFKSMPPNAASAVYRQWLDAMVAYLNEMEAPRQVVDAMLQTSSADIMLVHDEQFGLGAPPSIIEWQNAACGALTKQMKDRFSNIWVGGGVDRLPISERAQALKFMENYYSISTCQIKLLSKHRKKLE